MVTSRIYQIFGLIALMAISPWAAAANTIKVMTYNQYIGADLKPILETATRNDFNDELVAALRGMAANRFKDRVKQQAAIIAQEKPDVVALQEVWRFSCQDAFQTAPKQGCSDPSIAGAFTNFLDELIAALNNQGAKYKAISKVKNLDLAAIKESNFPAGIPFTINGFTAILNGADRDVILVRDDLKARAADFSLACPNRRSLDGCTYDLLFTSPTPVEPITILHGFTGADVKVGRKTYRIVNTHLEQRNPARFIQADQANELLQTLKRTTPKNRHLLLLGDMNSSPTDNEFPGIMPPYKQFLDAGLVDVWKLRSIAAPGYTCCQAENLLNVQSQLSHRIDFIFANRSIKSAKARLVGKKRTDKTETKPRLWPSDHAGIVAELVF